MPTVIIAFTGGFITLDIEDGESVAAHAEGEWHGRARVPANVLAAIDAGASFVEGAICGVGGGIAMPHTIASVGNLATEDIVHMLNEMGVETGVDTAEIAAAARDCAKLLAVEAGSHTAHVGTRADVMEGAKKAPREHPA